MNEKPNVNPDEVDEKSDDLDDAIINADDTGMVAQQHLVVEEELLQATKDESGENDPGEALP